MKKIEAIIRKSKFNKVKIALHKIDINFFYYWDITALGNERITKVYRGIYFSTADIQRRYISIVVNDDFEQQTIDTIIKASETGGIGDGNIFISDVNNTYRIRTGVKQNKH